MNLQDLSLKQFLAETAGSDPVPGGGSISALNGAIASALTGMLANLTIGKKKYEAVEEQMKRTAVQMAEHRKKFVDDIDRDSDAYNLLFSAYKMPKESDVEKAVRSAKIQEATKIAALVPMEVAERAFEMLDVIADTTRKGNRNAVTDGCVAMMACRTALLGALLNVRINLGGIKDEAFVKNLSERCAEMEKATVAKERELIAWVQSQIA